MRTPPYDPGLVSDLCIAIGLPYDEDDEEDFEPLNESDLKEWEEWLEYTCENIGITMEELKSQNFKYLRDLQEWCASGERYEYAQKKYKDKINQYRTKWLDEIMEESGFEEYTRNQIEDKIDEWLQGFFEAGFIWISDTMSIFETEDGNGMTFFDTSPMEALYSMLNE